MKTLRVERFSLPGLVVALLDSRVVGPYPKVGKFLGEEKLRGKIEADTQVVIGDEVKVGKLVVIRRDQF